MVIFTASQNDSRTEKYIQRIVVIFAVLSYILYPLFHFYYMNLYYLLNFRLWKTHIQRLQQKFFVGSRAKKKCFQENKNSYANMVTSEMCYNNP